MFIQTEDIAPILEDARKQLGSDDIEYAAWHQTWGNTCCGFGGVGGQAMTRATTVVVWDDRGPCVVYCANRLVRIVKKPTRKFWQRVHEWNLPGAADRAAWRELDDT